MKPRTFTSHKDLYDIVVTNTFPGLIPTDRLILMTLVARATWEKGGHSHPGLDFLCATTGGRDRRTIQRRLEFLEKLGAIECTAHAKGGRGLAPEYRFCMESEHYIDPVDKGRHGAALSSDEKGGTDHSENGLKGGTLSPKGGTEADKGRQNEAENGLKGGTWVPPHPKLHPKNIQPPSNPEATAKECLKTRREVDGFFLKNLSAMNNSQPGDKAKAKVYSWAAEYGLEVLQVALAKFLDRGAGLKGVDHPWSLFVKEAKGPTGWGAVAKAAILAEKALVEARAETERRCIEQARKEREAREAEKPSGIDIETFIKGLRAE